MEYTFETSDKRSAEIMILAPRMLAALIAIDDYITGNKDEDYKPVEYHNLPEILDGSGFPYALLEQLKTASANEHD